MTLKFAIVAVLHCGCFPVSLELPRLSGGEEFCCRPQVWCYWPLLSFPDVFYPFLVCSVFFLSLCNIRSVLHTTKWMLLRKKSKALQVWPFFLTELNDREEKDIHFPIIYGIGELNKNSIISYSWNAFQIPVVKGAAFTDQGKPSLS